MDGHFALVGDCYSEAVYIYSVGDPGSPESSAFTATGSEDTIIVVDGWDYSGQSGSPSGLLISRLPGHGTLFLDVDDDNTVTAGEAIALGQEMTWSDATTDGKVKFAPAPNWNGETTFTFVVDTASGRGAPTEATLQVNPVNDAPVLDGSAQFMLAQFDPDHPSLAGNSIEEIIGSRGGDPIVDPDGVVPEGIAVVGVDTTNGVWEYTTDRGTTWTAFSDLSETSATLLASGGTATCVRFVPNDGWTGTVDLGITFRAWDGTSGSNGATGVDVSANGGETSFSASIGTASITVTPDPVHKLTAADGSAGDDFGYSVSIDGEWAIVGAPGAAVGPYQTGAAYLFHWNGVSWVQEQAVTPHFVYCPYDFGRSVAIQGDLAIVTGGTRYGEMPPAVWTYECKGDSWVLQDFRDCGDGQPSMDGDFMAMGSQLYEWMGWTWAEQQLVPSDRTDGWYPSGSVWLDGDHLVMGLPAFDDGGNISYSVAAYLFVWDGQSWVEQQKLTPPDNEGDGYGTSVSLDGDLAVVTAPGDVYWPGYDDEDPNSSPEPPPPSALAYVYLWDGVSWGEQQQQLTPTGDYTDLCRNSVSNEGDFIVIADVGDNEAGEGAGAAHVWRWDGTSWVEQGKITAFDAASADQFGWMIAQDNGLLVVGAPAAETDRAGSAYIYRLFPVEDVQEPPQAGPFVETGNEDTTIVIDAWNYTDSDGDPATAVTIGSLPSNGVLFLDSDGDNVLDAGEIVSVGREITWADASSNHMVKFAPDADWWGDTSFTYSVKDADEYGGPADAQIVVEPVNDPNEAGLFVRIGYENTVFTIDGWSYTDPDGDTPFGLATAVTIHSLPSNGVLFLDSDGDKLVSPGEAISVGQEISWADATTNQAIKFAPDLDWFGPTSLRYSVKDPVEYGAPAAGLILVYPVNDPPQAGAFEEIGEEGVALVINGWNYSDPDGDPATALTIHSLPSNGVLFLDANFDDVVDTGEAVSVDQEIAWEDAAYGMVKFAPDPDWYGVTSLSYSVKDAEEYGDPADAAITIQYVNTPPDAEPFTEIGPEDTVITIDGWGYTDVDGDAATALTIHTLPSNGILFLDSDGDSVVDDGEAITADQEIPWADAVDNELVKFLPTADWFGVTSLTYSVKDADEYGAFADATVTVEHANNPPDAAPFSVTGNEDTVITIAGWNYTDVDGDAATALTIHTLPSNGILFLDGDGDSVVDAGEAISAEQEIAWVDLATGMVKFAPDADWNGSASLTYSVTDGEEYGATADASIVVLPVNDPPQAGPFNETVDLCKWVITVDGWNYTDADGDNATAIIVLSLPDHGKLFLDRDGDNRADWNEAIYVGQEISWDDATGGMVKFAPDLWNGWFHWSHWCHCSPWDPWDGASTVTYAVTDGIAYGGSAVGTLTWGWGHQNTPPVAGAFTETGGENSAIVIDGWNFTDADGDAAESLKVTALPDHGTLFVDRDGDNRVDCGEAIKTNRSIDWDDATSGLVKFSPDAGWDGTTVLTYTVSDGEDYGPRADASIVVESWNTPPVAEPFSETGPRKEVLVLDGWSYTDADGHEAVWLRVTDLPGHGTLFLDRDGDDRVDCHETIRIGQEISWDDAASGMVKFDPKGCWNGATSLEYQVSDGWEYGPSADATITITPKNHRPETQCFVECGAEDTVIVIDGWSIKHDKEGDEAVSVTIHTLPRHGALFLDADGDNQVTVGEEIVEGQVISWADATVNGLVKFSPDADWHGTTEFLHSVNDPWNEGSKAPVHIQLENDFADGPVAGSFTVTGTEPDTLAPVEGWTWTDTDCHATLTLEITSVPGNGILFVDKDGDGSWSEQETIEAGWKAQLAGDELCRPVYFLPDEGWTGSTTFTYRVNDGAELGPEAEVSVVVNDGLSDITGGTVEADSSFMLMAEAQALGSPFDEEPRIVNGIEYYLVDISQVGTEEGTGYRYRPSGQYNEYIIGTDGDDIIDCSGLDARYIIFGMDGADYIEGGNLDDVILGFEHERSSADPWDWDKPVDPSNVQTLIGNGGRDYIKGGPRDDIIYGDSPSGGPSYSDYIEGYEGGDTIFGDSEFGDGSGADTIDAGPGGDTIYGDSVYGSGSGGDEIKGGSGNDMIWGDSVYGEGSGIDEIWGGDGDDILYADSELGSGSGDDTVSGGTGNDVIYGDSRTGSGSGCDELDGNGGSDIIYGDSMLGSGSGRDKLYGGWGSDIIYGDSLAGEGSGDDYLFGDEGSDQLYGDSYLSSGSGSDTILGSLGFDWLYGDSYEGVGTGHDRLDGGMDDDVIYGDSVKSDGVGNDILIGGEGSDILVGDSEDGDGSGTDWLDGHMGVDSLYGDSRNGNSLGLDMLIRGEGGEAVAGHQLPGDTVILEDIENPIHSYQVNGHTAQYREDPETGAIQIYNYEMGQWDNVAERHWDAERNAWVTITGPSVTVEYASKTIRYDNYSDEAWILEDGEWKPYNPDDRYIVDFREDPETGELLVYNNDLGTWDPYMREYAPAGEDYTVYNDGFTILITDTTGCMLSLDNLGDGARAKAADSYRWVEFFGDLMYHDEHTNIWYAHGWDTWSYSIDLGVTWQEVPMLEIGVATDGHGGTGSADIFDRTSISHNDSGLQFFDHRYAQSGQHSIDEFYVDLYDGQGYDGEPLATYYYYYYTDPDEDDPARGAIVNIPDSGPDTPPDPNVVPVCAKIVIFGKWTDKCKADFEIPHTSSPSIPKNPLTVVFQADDLPSYPVDPIGPQDAHLTDAYWQIYRSVGEDVIYKRYEHEAYGMRSLVNDLECLHYVACDAADQKIPIENIVIFNHSTVKIFWIGVDEITHLNFTERTIKLCNRLNDITCCGSQIQYHGCSTAGIDILADSSNFNPLEAELYPVNNLVNNSWWGRSVLMQIAMASGTTVFASSDTDEFTIVYDESGHPLGQPIDMCLEFGVDSDGVQVNYQTCNWEWLDHTKWLGIGPGWEVIGSPADVQRSFDSVDAVVDFFSLGPDGTVRPYTLWPTAGEEGGEQYGELYKWVLDELAKRRT